MKVKAYQNVADSIASLYTIPISLIDIANDEDREGFLSADISYDSTHSLLMLNIIM